MGITGIIHRKEKVDDRAQTVEMLHRRYAGVIFDLCVRMLSDPQEAQDAVQETFVSAFRSLSSFRYGESYLPWLYRIGTNVCLKMIRTRRRKAVTLTDYPERFSPDARDPSSAMDARRVLERLADELDQRSLEIAVAHYISGMDQGQIARAMGISRRAVVKRLTAIRKRIGDPFKELIHE
jgi:RNA polymerase sigma-70 factor (ECF subfamily)